MWLSGANSASDWWFVREQCLHDSALACAEQTRHQRDGDGHLATLATNVWWDVDRKIRGQNWWSELGEREKPNKQTPNHSIPGFL